MSWPCSSPRPGDLQEHRRRPGYQPGPLREGVLRDRERRATTTPATAGRTPARTGTSPSADPDTSQAPDLFQRDFTAAEPGLTYKGDPTYLPLANGGFLCLATILDCFNQKMSAGSSPATCTPTWSPTP